MIAAQPGRPALAVGTGRPPHERAIGEQPDLVRRALGQESPHHPAIVFVLEALVGRAPAGLGRALAEAGDEILGERHGVGFEPAGRSAPFAHSATAMLRAVSLPRPPAAGSLNASIRRSRIALRRFSSSI